MGDDGTGNDRPQMFHRLGKAQRHQQAGEAIHEIVASGIECLCRGDPILQHIVRNCHQLGIGFGTDIALYLIVTHFMLLSIVINADPTAPTAAPRDRYSGHWDE